MEKRHIFYGDQIGQIEENIKELLNSQEDFLSAVTINSPRAVGDAVQQILPIIYRRFLVKRFVKTIQHILPVEPWLISLSRMIKDFTMSLT
ncbi:hypothetical protein RHP47_01110 [Thermosynechococcus sp. QKsg1]|uniref:hypothetical protein n=1 Tax=Thermosynechococcus sp. QKsg1 TaxID=3074130 RepID=UPI002877522A|nr:hypothetical protein [Thermosynechococcus sp. QKsg1]WNC86941.1 hypothetical protein RHP47_01110 [Thermosynechococcus sp. QKsg1]